MAATQTQTVIAGGVPLNIRVMGEGPPCLVLHPEIGLASHDRFLELIAQQRQILLPTHPGFETSESVEDIDSIDDLAYVYLDLLKALDLRDVELIGFSLGGWIAAEIAVRSTERLARIALTSAFGIKVGDRENRDIVDIFAVDEDELAKLAYFDVSHARNEYANFRDDEILIVARNREATARYGWSPYMHNPKLKRRLHRIDVPALVLWGAQDRIVAPDYGHAFALALPHGRFELIERAGHYPQIEQPEAVVEAILKFGTHSFSQAGDLSHNVIGAAS